MPTSQHRAARIPLSALAFLLASSMVGAHVAMAQQPAAADPGVPADLRPLLAPRRSEMRLVIARYTQDRALLNGNYAGGGGGGGGGGGRGAGGAGGRGGGDPVAGRGGGGAGAGAPDTLPPASVPISPSRIARLKRFDLSWQTAVERIEVGGLSAAARADRDTLLQTIARNRAAVDAEAVTLGNVTPLLPFAPKLVGVIESRLRLLDLDAYEAARTLSAATADVRAARARLAGEPGAANPFTATRAQLVGAAVATETFRQNLSAWSGFYDTYDPLFMWWVPMPLKQLDQTLASYAAFLRDSVRNIAPGAPAVAPLTIPPSPAPTYSEVPDLRELLSLPQDEMSDVVDRFFGRGGGGGAGRGGRGGAGGAGGPRDAKYYTEWLTALKTLDFDRLSRNAQVDYLYLKKYAEIRIAREGKALPTTNPRKTDNTGIPGAARGREGLIWDLQDELIPYTPEQLMAFAEQEFAWCDKEMLKASREMGFGDNWKAALEKTKTMHVDPGKQPGMIRDLIFEAIDYLRAKDLVTVPQIGAESQRMSMMSPERQLSSPFFLGGSQIIVSYPTNTMDFDTREQSMRGNNRPWSHATAFHEMIPGHNLVGYTGSRYSGYRANLGAGGPFFGEGWPLYWELTLYEKGFHDTPEERVGALFWRMHRCARIIFSLKFHMGQWSPQEAIDFLVDRVGHERDNATAEVRRSFQGGYGPLYQAAYLLGGMQLRGLRKELVDTKAIPEKAFHDEILRQGSMPIALIKLALTKQKLTRDMTIDWKFAGDLPEK